MRPGVDVEITREPIGVVGLITPWNFPIAIPAWKIAPALAYGNTVVFKPAQWTPGCAWVLAEILAAPGFPPGVFNLVMGSGSVVGETLVNHPDVAAISFTGSVEPGRAIARKAIGRMAKFQLEMGGKNPLVVLDDADSRPRSTLRCRARYFSTGQRCTASSRLIVTEGIHDRFVERGRPSDSRRCASTMRSRPEPTSARSSNKPQLEQDLEYIAVGQREGARLATGGERLKRATDGYYMAPALFVDATNAMRISREEIFGPVACVIRAKRLRRGARDRQRHRDRPVLRDRDDVAEACVALQAPCAGGHGDGQPADRGRRLSRAVRRPQGFELRPARTGSLRGRVLHDGQDHLHRTMRASRLAFAAAAIILLSVPRTTSQTPTAPEPRSVPARTLPAPGTVSPEMQTLIAAPLRGNWNTAPNTVDEWRKLSAPSAGRNLAALRERFGVKTKRPRSVA